MTIAGNWRTRHQRYGLRAEVCNACGSTIFPPRDVCPECAHEKQSWTSLSGRGEVYSYTVLYSPPANFEEYAPYTVALVKLAEGPVVTAQLTDVEANDVFVGMPVEMVTRKLSEEGEEGQILYSYKFRPLMAEAA